MFTHSTKIRVHYALTDQMGLVYYGHYAQFFEIARTESIRHLGFTYKSLEDMGIIMPVGDYHCRYLHGIGYDELITVTVSVTEWPVRKRIVFHGTIHNEAGTLCTTSEVVLYFMSAATRKLVPIPENLEKVMAPFFPAEI
jgi:acyl-CoA thioester hydrolase